MNSRSSEPSELLNITYNNIQVCLN